MSAASTLAAIEARLRYASVAQLEKYGYTRDSSGRIIPKPYRPGQLPPPISGVSPSLNKPQNSLGVSGKLPILHGEEPGSTLTFNPNAPGVTPAEIKEMERSGKIAAEGGADAASGGVANPLGPSKIALSIADGLLGLVEPVATKGALYLVFILGAIALFVYGLTKLFEPIGGPNLKHELGKTAQLAAVV